MMPKYNVFPIESPVSPSHLAAYKTLRLTSLQMDPEAFGFSSYAREAAYAEDYWQVRLEAPFKRTLIASVVDTSHKTVYGDIDKKPGETGEWIGTVGIVGPSGLKMFPSVLAPFRDANVGANWEVYVLYGMWVHPAHRGKGVGAQLVKACLEWARTDVDKSSSENSGDFEKVVALLVYENNTSGRMLYSRTGFTDLEGVPAEERELRWMLARV